ncbi:MAG: hypothetical protein H7249_07695 [Chitinophagaceae bacterium]|nr:hypothetical protein [Oligoflexus sp.]
MFSIRTIIAGSAAETATVGQTKLGAGLDILPGVIVDQHFSQRGRTNRLLSAIASNPHFLAIGIDENTSIVVTKNVCSVIGDGSFTVLDIGKGLNGLPDRDDDADQDLALSGVNLHLLAEGSQFDLRNCMVMKVSGSDSN